jgi:hypothetical protein
MKEKMMKRDMTILTIVGAVALAAAAIYAQPHGGSGPPGRGGAGFGGPGGPPGGPGGPPPALSEQTERLAEAGVSEEQIEKLAEVEYKHASAMIDLRAEQQKADLALRRAVRQDEPDEDAVMAAVARVNAARGAVLKEDVGFQLTVRKIVGDDVLRELRPPRGHRPGPDGPQRRSRYDRPGE